MFVGMIHSKYINLTNSNQEFKKITKFTLIKEVDSSKENIYQPLALKNILNTTQSRTSLFLKNSMQIGCLAL